MPQEPTIVYDAKTGAEVKMHSVDAAEAVATGAYTSMPKKPADRKEVEKEEEAWQEAKDAALRRDLEADYRPLDDRQEGVQDLEHQIEAQIAQDPSQRKTLEPTLKETKPQPASAQPTHVIIDQPKEQKPPEPSRATRQADKAAADKMAAEKAASDKANEVAAKAQK